MEELKRLIKEYLENRNEMDRLKNKNDKIRADIAEIVDYANTKLDNYSVTFNTPKKFNLQKFKEENEELYHAYLIKTAPIMYIKERQEL